MTPAAPRPLLRKVRPPSGFAALDLRELWAYRDLVVTLATRDVMLRYRQTALGVAWVLLQPLVGAGLLAFVFGKVAGLDKGSGTNYFLLTFAGQLFFALFSGILTKSSGSLVGNTGLVSKVYFPRLALPLSTIASSLLDFVVGFAVLIPLLFLLGSGIGIGLLTLPFWLLLGALMAIGWGLICSSLMVSYRDVAYILPVVVSFLNLGSPVGWQLSRVPKEWLTPYLLANPMAILLEGFRWSVTGRGAFPLTPGLVLYAAIVAFGVFVGGAFVFRSLERRFADVI